MFGTESKKGMDLDPADFTFYTDGFRYGAPPHAGWGLGVARLLMILTGAGNVREVVLNTQFSILPNPLPISYVAVAIELIR